MKPKKQHGVHRLVRHAGCKCKPSELGGFGRRCRPVTAGETCKSLCNKWLYPPVADSKEAARLEKAFRKGEIGQGYDTESDEEAELAAEIVRQQVEEEDEGTLQAMRGMGDAERAEAAAKGTEQAVAAAKHLSRRAAPDGAEEPSPKRARKPAKRPAAAAGGGKPDVLPGKRRKAAGAARQQEEARPSVEEINRCVGQPIGGGDLANSHLANFGRYLVKVRKRRQDDPGYDRHRLVGFYDNRVDAVNAFCAAFRAEWS